MKIVDLSQNTLAQAEINGNMVKMLYKGKELELNISEIQEEFVKTVDVVEDDSGWGIGQTGEKNTKYIASIVIPAKEYEMKNTGDVDQEDNPVFEKIQIDNLYKTEIRLF